MGSFSILVSLLVISTVPVMSESVNNTTAKTYEELVALGSSVVEDKSNNTRTGYFDAETLRLCQNAPNCEIYDDSRVGKAIRFVKGMEPGSAHYNATVLAEDRERNKNNNGTVILGRAAGDTAKFTAGTNVINWGNVQPQVVLNHLYDRCQEATCSPQLIWYGTQAVRRLDWGPASSASAPAAYSLIAEAHGDWYEWWDMRNNFVEAIKKMSEKGQQWTNAYWGWGIWTGTAWASDSGSLWEIRQSDFYAISAWSSSGFMRGNINVYITADWGDKANWGCDRARDLVKDMISAINGWAGAFFGFITPAC